MYVGACRQEQERRRGTDGRKEVQREREERERRVRVIKLHWR